MSKLQFLNAYFTERLMTAVHEIMKVVGDTLFEYQDETERTKRENEILRHRLRDVGFDAEAGFLHSIHTAPPLSADSTVAGRQEWISTGQDTESTLTAVKIEFSELSRNRLEEEEHRRLETVIPSTCSKSECEQDSLIHPKVPLPSGKRDSQNRPDLKLQIGNKEEPVPSATHFPVKTETDGIDCDISEQPSEPLFADILNRASQIVQSENSVRVNEDVSSQQMLMSTEQHSKKEKTNVRQGENSLTCFHCGRVFIHASKLKSHLRSHTDDCKFRCSACGKCFSQSRLLTAHQRVHNQNKHCCNICGKGFNHLANLKEHRRIHTGERPFCCSFCGKYFSQSGHLKAHVRTHTGEKPFKCPVCQRCFIQSSVLKRHLRVHSS